MGVFAPIIDGMSLFEPMLIAEHGIDAPTAGQSLAEEFGEFGLGQGVLDEGVLIYGMFLRGPVIDASPSGTDNRVQIGLAFNPDFPSAAGAGILQAQRGIFANIVLRTEVTTSGMATFGGPDFRWEPPEAILLRRNPAVFNFQNLATTKEAVVTVYYKRVTLRRDTFNALITRT